MPEIISASRRTDIPAFFSEWFLRRLEAGRCEYWHTFSRRWFEVSLRPEDVYGIVFWTKNIGPLLPELPAIRERYPFYVHLTITGHAPEIERNIIPWEQAVEQAWEISRGFGEGTLVWRFDPIVHTQFGGPQETLARFRMLCAELAGATRRCIISFMSPYRRQRRAFEQAGIEYHPPSAELRQSLLQELAEIAAQHSMTVAACCNDDVVRGPVLKAHCVDPDLLREAGASIPTRVRKAPSRKQCGCYRSLDIGAYDLCAGGCVYCYANQDHELAERNRAKHDPDHSALAEAFIERKR